MDAVAAPVLRFGVTVVENKDGINELAVEGGCGGAPANAADLLVPVVPVSAEGETVPVVSVRVSVVPVVSVSIEGIAGWVVVVSIIEGGAAVPVVVVSVRV